MSFTLQQARDFQRLGLRIVQSSAVAVLASGAMGWAMAQPQNNAALPSSPLTFAAALQAAESRSAQLTGQDAVVRSYQALAVSAGRLPDPVMRVSVDNLPIEGPMRYSLNAERMTMRSISLAQTFTREDKRAARSTRFIREAEAASAMRLLQVSKLRTQTARAWFERFYQQQTLMLLLRQRDAAVLVAEASEASYRGGRGSQENVFAVRTAIARIDDKLHAVSADVSNAKTQLARWIGDAATQPLGAPPNINSTRLSAHELSHQLDQHPDLALMRAKEEVALADAAIAEQDKSADWRWSVRYSKRGDQFGDMLSVGVDIPLQWDQKERQDREYQAKLERVTQVRADREEMLREHSTEVQQMLTNWRSNLARLANYDSHLIPLASQRSQAAQAAFRGMKGTLAAVLDARRMEVDTQLERLKIEKQTAALWSELEFLVPEQEPFDSSTKTESLTSMSTQEQTP